MFNKEIADRLVKVRKDELGYSDQKIFSEYIGIKWRTLQTYEQGTVKKMPLSYFDLLHEQFNVSKEWILTGEGEIFEHNQQKPSVSIVVDTNRHIIVPISSAQASGSPSGKIHYEVVESGEMSISKMMFKTIPNIENVTAIEVKGNSMYPRITEGDYVVVDKTGYFDYDGIYVLQIDGMLLVKRLQVTTKGLKIISDNRRFDDDFYDPENDQRSVSIFGKVILVINRDMASF